MRKITSKSISAFLERKEMKSGNMQVMNLEQSNETVLKLHGHTIALLDDRGDLWITLAGWPTPTTRDRLNGLPGVSATQHDFEQFLNGKPWDGSWTKI